MDPEVVPILREIRDEVREIRTEARETNARLGVVETALVDLAEQQRFVVRYLRTLSDRDGRLGDEVAELRRRLDRIEDRLGPE